MRAALQPPAAAAFNPTSLAALLQRTCSVQLPAVDEGSVEWLQGERAASTGDARLIRAAPLPQKRWAGQQRVDIPNQETQTRLQAP